jgi:catechol-2,3-dioxygenase
MSDFYQNILGLSVFKTFDHGKFQKGVVFELNNTLVELLEQENEVKTETMSYLYIEKNNVEDFFKQIEIKLLSSKKLKLFLGVMLVL